MSDEIDTRPALPPPTEAEPPRRAPLLPEHSDFLEGGEAPAAAKVEAFLAQAFAASGSESPAQALVPWICDALLSNHSVKAYGRDLMDFLRHMEAQGVTPLEVTADHVKLYKRALLEAGMKSATVARRLSVLRGTYHQLAAKGLVPWETAQDIGAVKAPGVQENSTPSLTQTGGVWPSSDYYRPRSMPRAGRLLQGRASRTMFVGVSVALRTRLKPPAITTSRKRASPAWAPRARPTS
jgi:hypothetical protein